MGIIAKSLVLALVIVGGATTAWAEDNTEKGAAPAKKAAVKKKPQTPPKREGDLPKKPKDPALAVETTLIEPSLVYRMGKLWPRARSVFHKVEHGDYFDQIYATLKFQKTIDYVHTIVVEPGLRTMRENPAKWDDAHHFEQAYIESAITDNLLLTAGKKAEYEGSGFIVNPSDLLNENKDILDAVYQKEGVVFTRLKLRLPAEFSIGLGFIPLASAPTNKGRGLLQLAGEIKQVEIRLSMTEHEREKTTTGLSVQRFFGEHLELHFDGRFQARQRDPQSEGNSYLAYSSYHSDDSDDLRKHDDPSGFYLGGSRLVITPRRTVIVESVQQQSGLLPDEFRQYFADLREQNQQFSPRNPATKLQGRHYVFASYQDDQSVNAMHLSANYLVNTDDQSSFAILSARYALSPLTSVELSPTFYSGRVDSEFGEEPFSQGYYVVFRGRF